MSSSRLKVHHDSIGQLADGNVRPFIQSFGDGPTPPRTRGRAVLHPRLPAGIRAPHIFGNCT
jgi:hypothetical protein